MNKDVEKMVKELIRRKVTISTMESCTGGGLVNEITTVPGASEILKFSAITYSNEFKVKMGVDKTVIEKYSVYSAETAQEMSYNISKFAKSDYGIGVTGKLKRFDPANEQGENDVVFVCVCDRRKRCFHHITVKVSHDTREENKQEVISAAAKLVMDVMLKRPNQTSKFLR